jgi:aspartyl aminopeptidase
MEKSFIGIARTLASDFIEFVNRAVSPFHVTQESKILLLKSGFVEISEQENWDL